MNARKSMNTRVEGPKRSLMALKIGSEGHRSIVTCLGIVVLLAGAVACLAVTFYWFMGYQNNRTPVPLVPSSAQLLDQSMVYTSQTTSWYTAIYEVNLPLSDVEDYYRSAGQSTFCPEFQYFSSYYEMYGIEFVTACSGRADPFGRYHVELAINDGKPEVTYLVIEVRWGDLFPF